MKLTLHYPCRPYYLNQQFGYNIPCVEDTPNIPLDKRRVVSGRDNNTCPIGYIKLYPLLNLPKGHSGLDFYAPHGTKIYHCGPESIVEEVQTEEARGLGLGLVSFDKFEVEGDEHYVKIRYWHLLSFTVRKGDIVKTGQLIGYADNTGFSSGSHLHLELKPVIKSDEGTVMNVYQKNGYYGAIDPLPFFKGKYAQDIISQPITKQLYKGMRDPQVKVLQEFLKREGFFPYEMDTTDYYGVVTARGVKSFQEMYGVAPWYELFLLQGSRVGPKTLKKIQSILET